MKKIVLLIIISIILVGGASNVLANCPAGYSNSAGICVPSNTGLSEAPVRSILLNVSNWVFSLVGVLAVLMILISGVMYLSSAGNERTQETAKRILIWSIIGLIVALLSWVVLITVANMLSSS